MFQFWKASSQKRILVGVTMSHGTVAVGKATFKKWLDKFIYGYIDIPAVHLLPT